MTWGTKLLLVFAAFAILLSTLVFLCMKQNFELVSKDYYADELRYQDRIDGMNNLNKIGAVAIKESEGKIAIQLPKKMDGLTIKGEALFYCPTNSVNDRTITLKVNDEGLMLIDKSTLTKTRYQVKLHWQIGKDQYYTEQDLSIY